MDPPDPLPESVDSLADSTAGGQVRFQTNSRRLRVRVALLEAADMDHMPATGQCGFDVYVGPPGQQRFVGTARFDRAQSTYEASLFEYDRTDMRNITVNFPLYQGVREVSLGLDSDCRVEPPPPRAIGDPIVAYGTSITQGGCASRPGMAYTNLLSRSLNVDFVNLGFSGSGRGEPAVARAMASVPAASLFILDYDANSTMESLQATLPGFIAILRETHALAPILVVSRIRYAPEALDQRATEARRERLTFQRDTVASLKRAGDGHIHFFDGSTMLGDDFDECTVDGTHPTDLGFLRMARSLEPVLRDILLL